jgi:hypothetical protein
MLPAQVDAQALLGVTDRPVDRDGQFGACSERGNTDLEYARNPSSVSMYGSEKVVMMMFRGSPRYGGLWLMYCIRKNVSGCDSDVIGTLSHIEKPSTVDPRVEPALVLERGLACNNCLSVTGGWVCCGQNKGIE